MLSIGNFSKIANVTTKRLRYYDEIGLLKPIYVDSDTGYRFYDAAQLESVLLINRLKTYGFTLNEIQQVLKNPKDNTLLLSIIVQKRSRIETLIADYVNVLKQIKGDIANLERGNHLMSYLDNIQVDLMETKPMRIAYVREKMKIAEYGEYMKKLRKRIAQENRTEVAPPMTIFHSEEFHPDSYDMEIAIPVEEAGEGVRDYPALLCAHATLKGNYSGLPSVYAKIREWIEQNGYVLAAPSFEAYPTDPAETPPDENITEVYFPVKRK